MKLNVITDISMNLLQVYLLYFLQRSEIEKKSRVYYKQYYQQIILQTIL